MVSFSCEACNETMLKKKVAAHIARCHAPVTCIDCSKTFPGQTFKEHNQCMTEDQKYQGKLYKPKQLTPKAAPVTTETPAAKKTEAKKTEAKKTEAKKMEAKKTETASTTNPVKVSKKQPLKKLLKKLRNEHNFDKKQLLSKLTVDTEGRLLFTM